MINTNKAVLALTSLSDQVVHAQIAIRLSRENDQIFSAIPVINSAINSAIMDESNFVDGGLEVAFASSGDSNLIVNYLKNLDGVTDVVIQPSRVSSVRFIIFKIIDLRGN